jgi:thiol-disulfide isomerase/thioredoxin
MPFSSDKPTKSRILFAVALAVGLLSSCSSKSHRVIPAPNFELKDLSGNTVRLESFRGHPVLLDFWATWCGPCRMSIPMVQDFYARHKAEGLVVIGMNIDDDPSGVFSFVKKFHMTYTVVFAGNSTAPSDYEVEGIPHFVSIDPAGNVVRIYQGFSPDMVGAWEEDLQASLKKS